MVAIVIVYVDDLIFTGSWTDRVRSIMHSLETTFEMTDLGLFHFFLGFEIYQTPHGIFFSQRKYATDILDRHRMGKARPIGTPLEPGVNLSIHDPSSRVDQT